MNEVENLSTAGKSEYDKEEETRQNLAFWHRSKLAVTWSFATFLISMCSLCQGQHADVNI